MKDRFLNEEDLYNDTSIKNNEITPIIVFQLIDKDPKNLIPEPYVLDTLNFIIKKHYGFQSIPIEKIKIKKKYHNAKNFVISISKFKMNKFRIYEPIYEVQNIS